MPTQNPTPNPASSQAPRSSQARPLTPRQVFERIQHISLHRDAPVADLYAADGVHEWPFALPGVPQRLSGQDEIRAFFSRAAGASRYSCAGNRSSTLSG